MSNVTGGTNPGIVIGGTGQSSVDPSDVTDSSQRVVTPPPCPACEAAARERDAMHKGWSEATLRECKLSDELTDLRTRLARARRLLDQVAEFQSFTMPEFEQARALLREEEAGENGMDILDRAIDRIEEHSWTQDGPMSDEDDAAIDLLKECREAAERELYAQKEAK